MPSDLQIIVTDAANEVRRRLSACEIGVRPLHGIDRTWFLVFGQQPLCGPFVGMVNEVTRWIGEAGGEAICIGADDSRSAWAMLVRLPFMFHVGTLRGKLYESLAEQSKQSVDQIQRSAETTGDGAVFASQDFFNTLAARVGDALKALHV